MDQGVLVPSPERLDDQKNERDVCISTWLIVLSDLGSFSRDQCGTWGLGLEVEVSWLK
jgi:hypothetical protein